MDVSHKIKPQSTLHTSFNPKIYCRFLYFKNEFLKMPNGRSMLTLCGSHRANIFARRKNKNRPHMAEWMYC